MGGRSEKRELAVVKWHLANEMWHPMNGKRHFRNKQSDLPNGLPAAGLHRVCTTDVECVRPECKQRGYCILICSVTASTVAAVLHS